MTREARCKQHEVLWAFLRKSRQPDVRRLHEPVCRGFWESGRGRLRPAGRGAGAPVGSRVWLPLGDLGAQVQGIAVAGVALRCELERVQRVFLAVQRRECPAPLHVNGGLFWIQARGLVEGA